MAVGNVVNRLSDRPSARAIWCIKLLFVEPADCRSEHRRKLFYRVDVCRAKFRIDRGFVEFAYWIAEVWCSCFGAHMFSMLCGQKCPRSIIRRNSFQIA